jgi:hypothetical protein
MYYIKEFMYKSIARCNWAMAWACIFILFGSVYTPLFLTVFFFCSMYIGDLLWGHSFWVYPPMETENQEKK